MNQHTPGPWHSEWVPWGNERDLKIVTSEGVLLTMNRTGYLLSEAAMEANARLIAKAPEMYVLVKRAVCDAHHIQDGKQPCSVPRGRCSELCKRARALLRESEGDRQ